MKAQFTRSFKIQAVEKALSRDENTSMISLSDSLGVGAYSGEREHLFWTNVNT